MSMRTRRKEAGEAVSRHAACGGGGGGGGRSSTQPQRHPYKALKPFADEGWEAVTTGQRAEA